MSETEFKRTHFFRLDNGVEVRIKMPEKLWKERMLPFFKARVHPRVEDVVYREIIMEAMGLEVVGVQTDEEGQ